jgi:N-dimethylarginine dimethylaminohydrolase
VLDVDRLPPDYHQLLVPPEPEPPFHDPGEQEATWGRVWGASDEVGRLRSVLVRPPGPGLERIRADAWVPEAGALVDPEGGWYWTDREPPDLDLVAEQHAGLIRALEAEDVEVHVLDPLPERFTKGVYIRDPLITVPGGAIISRMAPRMRRGEEAHVTREVAALGMPILRTITGTGLLEGGSFVKVTPRAFAFGTSIRCNEVAAEQLRATLAPLGIELIVLPVSGFSIHLDLHLVMLDVDKALVDPAGLPHWFPDKLRELGMEPIWGLPDELWGLNALALRPGRVLMAEGAPRTRERLERRGVEVVSIPYDEIHKNGGGVHCSTMELVRDAGGA